MATRSGAVQQHPGAAPEEAADEDEEEEAPAEFSSKSRKALHRLTPALAELAKTAPRRQPPRDPRHDPLVNGRCEPRAWEFLREERRREADRLDKWLKQRGRHRGEEERDRVRQLLLRLRQLERREELRDTRSQVMQTVRKEQVEAAERTGRVAYLPRAELRARLEAAKAAGMSEKAKRRLEKRRASRDKRKRPVA